MLSCSQLLIYFVPHLLLTYICSCSRSYVDHFMYKGHLCIVTDYCEAGDLWQMLMARKTPLLEGQVCYSSVWQMLMARKTDPWAGE